MRMLGLSSMAYIGKRPYIRGVDLYACFESLAFACLPADQRPALIVSFKLHYEWHHNGHWWLIDDVTQLRTAVNKPAATLIYRDSCGRSRQAAFFADSDLITERRPDLQSVVQEVEWSSDFSGKVVLKPLLERSDFLNGVIEANKILHVRTLAARGYATDNIRLIYLEEMPVLDSLNPACASIELRFCHVSAHPGPGRVYTLNAVSIALAEEEKTGKVCFSY